MQQNTTLPEDHLNYISENWQHQSDAAIAKVLNTTKAKVYQNRNLLGIYKGRDRKLRDKPVSLNKESNYFRW